MSKQTGGPAFPSNGTMGEVVCEGMTLRDYLAAKASDCDVQDILNSHMRDFSFGSVHLRRSSITRQKARYMHADAMLLERAK